MHKSLLLFLALPTLLCSCVTPNVPTRTTFNEAEFAWFKAPGTSAVTGQAFLKTRGGEVRLGAGEVVVLFPVTSYTTELFNRGVLGGENLDPDPRFLDKYRLKTIADGNGNFEFRGLPAGEYYVVCEIRWQVPTQYGTSKTGGVACGTVSVGNGETAKVVVTR